MPNIIDTAIDAGFDTLVDAITAAGLDTTLTGPGPFTVFAPTQEAFSKLPSGTVGALLQDIPTLRKILEYHVVSGVIAAPEISNLDKITTAEGSDLKIESDGSNVRVNNATVTKLNIEADNGMIHAIDTVLLPASVSL